jgi:type IV pilus assembly protein PilY1
MLNKSFITICMFIPLAILTWCGISHAQTMADYTAYPPFVSGQITANVLIMLDNSGSMNEFAYKTAGNGGSSSSPDTSFDPNTTYYGYFISSANYSYSTAAGGHFYEDASGGWNGNFLNWLTMRRIDVIRKVLVGGKAIPRISGSPNYLVVGDSDRDYYKRYSVANTYAPFSSTRCFNLDNGEISVSTETDGSCSSFSSTYNIKALFNNTDEPLGVVQATWDRIRFGLMYFNDTGSKYEDGGGGNYDGGFMQDWVQGPGANTNLVTSIENTDPSTYTPLAESLYEATRFFRAGFGAYTNANYASNDPVQYGCQNNFVLIVTDGEATKDQNITGGAWGSNITDPDGFNVKTYMDKIASNEGYSSQWNTSANALEGTYYLEGVAYWARTNDMRKDFDEEQNIRTYTVFAFDDSPVGEDLLKKTAKYGDFEDSNDNDIPDLQGEWDEDGNGIPDAYFSAQDGSLLETALTEAIMRIETKAAAGSSVSVLATTGAGEGAVYQAYFLPEKSENGFAKRWLGYVHALFVDRYGNLREDTNSNKTLDMTIDNIIKMEYTPGVGTRAKKYTDSTGDGVIDTPGAPAATVDLDNINAIWHGGKSLWQTPPSSRTIFTTTDGFSKLDFTTSNASTLLPYVRAADSTEAENIINWHRGSNLTGITDAGHIKPVENYDLLYGDMTYANFRATHLKRRNVIYVGANDGMLHAFNAGCFDANTLRFFSDVDITGNCVSGSNALGKELWAFIPRGILPHLKWNTMPDYTHVYQVDLKPKITDVKIFTPDSTHVEGWGTILIGGFRYGGKDISWTSGGSSYSASPEYFALDITDPLNPRLLWTFSDPDLGLSMSYPSITKIGSDWYALFGSGPTDYDSGSNLTAYQSGRVFILKLTGGASGVINSWAENTNYWKKSTGMGISFLSDSISVDVDIDNDVDVIYLGENYQQGTEWYSLMRRITTSKGTATDPAAWTLSTLGDVKNIAGVKDPINQITSAPSAAMDERANLYVFFGTGSFLGTNDKNQTDSGGFYAIKDGCWNGTCTTSYSNLLDVSSAKVATDGSVSGISGSCGGGVSSWGNLLTASYSCDGWAMYFKNVAESVDFAGTGLSHDGERVLSKPLVLGGLAMWATYIPGIDECNFEGDSNVYAVYYETGTAFKKYVFTEQKSMASPSTTVARTRKLGTGMPSSLSAQVTAGGTAKGFAQQSTGSILEIESITPITLRSGVAGWKSEQLQ